MATAASVTPKKDNADYGDVTEKVIHDPVHKSMTFCEPLVSIIDTLEFQRLREIKQLGGTYLVYPGANHPRFAHSVGTAHLCGTVLKSLKRTDKDGRITEKNILCVQIAGLCHDLGQGPLSTVYEHQYLRKLKKTTWNPSDLSVKIFEIILEKEKINKVFQKYNIDKEDIAFIKHAMTGNVPANPTRDRFLYEMVINKMTGIDCHTFDAVVRDSFFSGINVDFDYTRCILSSSICKVQSDYRLCIRQKETFELGLLYHSIWTLQNRVYKHKTTTIIEMMFAEALAEAEAVFPEIHKAREDPKMLLTLDDCIINRIMHTDDKGLTKSQEIIMRIRERYLYQFCGQTEPTPFLEDDQAKANFCREISEAITSPTSKDNRDDVSVVEEDFVIDIVDIGMGEQLQKPNFVNKFGKLVTAKNHRSPKHGSPDANEADSGDHQFPYQLKNQFIRAYARDAKKKDAILARFYDWCSSKRFPVSVDREKVPVEHEDSGPNDVDSAKRKLTF